MKKRATRIKARKAKKKMKTRNKVLLALGIFIAAFIITMIVIFCVYGSTPDMLIQYVLGAGGLEALILAGITISEYFTTGRKKKKETESVSDENFVE